MENFSRNGKSLPLCKGQTYYVIDSIYITEIQGNIGLLDERNIETSLRDKIFAFPLTDRPFIKYISNHDYLDIHLIKKADYNIESSSNSRCYFACDSGSILFIEETIFTKFVVEFDCDKLFDSGVSVFNELYWKLLTGKYGLNIGLVFSPGINSGFDFDGGGTYTILSHAMNP